MRKSIFVFVALLAGVVAAPRAHAATSQAVTSVIATAGSSFTVSGMSISSAPATSIVVDTDMVYKQVCVQNVDTSYPLYCGDTVNVSSLTASNLLGVVIPPAAAATSPLPPTCFSIIAGMNFWCRSGSGGAATRAVVIRAR